MLIAVFEPGLKLPAILPRYLGSIFSDRALIISKLSKSSALLALIINASFKVSFDSSIDYPGTYTLESGTSLDELYNIVGRFKKEAYLEGIIFTRESVRNRQQQSIEESIDTVIRLFTGDLNETILYFLAIKLISS